MRRLDELHLEFPVAGSRMLRDLLRLQGTEIGRRHVRTLMWRMGLQALYRKPNTSRKNPAHPVFAYLLRDQAIERANQAWALDITLYLGPVAGSSCHTRRGTARTLREATSLG